MRPIRALLTAALAATIALPAAAGDTKSYEKKCTMSASDCLEQMTARFRNTGWIGVELEMDADSPGWNVRAVVPGSPAAKAGLQSGDILWAVEGVVLDGKNEAKYDELRKTKMKVGSSVTYTVKRGETTTPVKITLEAWPADLVAKYVGNHMLEHAATDVAAKPK